jgi:hypothetical protein
MSEQQQNSEEIWIRETVHCLVPPVVFVVLQGEDARYYPVRCVDEGSHSFVESIMRDSCVVSFERYLDALSFCRTLSSRWYHFCPIYDLDYIILDNMT